MNKILCLLVTFIVVTSPATVGAAPSSTTPVDPVAYTPDANTVHQISLSQSTYPSVASYIVFTEYAFDSEQLATDYYWGICSFLEADMASSPIPMTYLDLREVANPQCGFTLTKGTQASAAILHENRILTLWAFGPALAGPVGDFITVFLRTSTSIVDDAILPDPATVDAPWTVDGPKLDITEYAQTPIDLRD